MSEPLPKPTVRWLFTSFHGRIGRKSFALGALLLLLVQVALFTWVLSFGDGESSVVELEDGDALLVGIVFLAFWAFAAWGLLAMAVKRLHDLNLPGILAVVLLLPAIAFLGWLFLAFVPGSRQTNQHGPPPFVRD
ncbi:MAG: DUF805 domain-containing protein [Pseudomonadota bacterium]